MTHNLWPFENGLFRITEIGKNLKNLNFRKQQALSYLTSNCLWRYLLYLSSECVIRFGAVTWLSGKNPDLKFGQECISEIGRERFTVNHPTFMIPIKIECKTSFWKPNWTFSHLDWSFFQICIVENCSFENRNHWIKPFLKRKFCNFYLSYKVQYLVIDLVIPSEDGSETVPVRETLPDRYSWWFCTSNSHR